MGAATDYVVPAASNFLHNHYLTRDATGDLWLFYLTPEGSLQYGTSADGGESWTAPAVLTEAVTGPFTVSGDEKGRIYFCAVRQFSTIIFGQWDGSAWFTSTWPVNRRRGQPFFPMLHAGRSGMVHMVFSGRKHSGKWTVNHYMVNQAGRLLAKTSYPVPRAVDLILDLNTVQGTPGKYVAFLSGALDSDTQGNLHLIHRYFDGRYFQLYYNKFSVAGGRWGSPAALTGAGGNCGIPAMLIDAQDHLHLLWSTAQTHGHKLHYRKKAGDWQPPVVLAENSAAIHSPALVAGEAGPIACWYAGGQVYCRPLGAPDREAQSVPLWTGPADTRAVKINNCVRPAGWEAALPLTFARQTEEHYTLYFDTAPLLQTKTIRQHDAVAAGEQPDGAPRPDDNLLNGSIAADITAAGQQATVQAAETQTPAENGGLPDSATNGITLGEQWLVQMPSDPAVIPDFPGWPAGDQPGESEKAAAAHAAPEHTEAEHAAAGHTAAEHTETEHTAAAHAAAEHTVAEHAAAEHKELFAAAGESRILTWKM